MANNKERTQVRHSLVWKPISKKILCYHRPKTNCEVPVTRYAKNVVLYDT